MKIFSNDAYISADAAKNYATVMNRSHPKHMLPQDSPYFGSGNKLMALEEKIGAQGVTGAASFEKAMLQALDKVSSQQHQVSKLQTEAILNPDSVDVHDITIAQGLANMSMGTARNIMTRLVQSWRDIINTR
ncbi:MAG: flagellar hook-basal body complex protein FliE [Treponema sp.]|jgi:flagellar hook-basal body complex protein FliE|nr:flagellar hook-basal body complex protein FliE [Treponema sp.]